MQRSYFHPIIPRINVTSVEYSYGSFLRPIPADTNQNVSGKDIAAHSNEVTNSMENNVPLLKIIHRVTYYITRR